MPFQTGGNDVVATFGADLSGFDKGVSDVESKLDKLVSGMSGQMAMAATAISALTLPLLAIGKGLLDIGIEFDDAFDKIRIGTGATGEALQGLEQSFRNVVSTVPTSFAKAGEALTLLAQRTGLTGAALEDLTRQELELARMTGADLRPQIEATTKLFTNWGERIGDPITAMDTLFKVSQRTGITVTQLAQDMTKAGAPLRALGFDFSSAAVLIAQFDKAGVDVSKTTMALSKALINMKGSVKDPEEAFVKLIDKIKNAGSEMAQLEIATKSFGGRAAVQLVDAINAGRFAVGDLTAKVKESQETIIQAAKDTMDFTERLQVLGNQAKLAAEPLAAELFGGINGLMDPLEKLVEDLGFLVNMFVALPPEIKNAAEAFVVGGAAMAAIIAVVGAVAAAVTILVTLLGGPLTLAFLALMGTAALLSAGIAFEWDKIKQIFSVGVGHIDISGRQIASILGTVADVFGAMADVAIMNLDAIVSGARLMVQGISAAFSALRNAILPALAGLATGNMGMFAAGLANIGTITAKSLSEMGGLVSAHAKRMNADIESITNHVGGTFRGAFEKAFDSASAGAAKLKQQLDALFIPGEPKKPGGPAGGGKGGADEAEKQAAKIEAAWDKVAKAVQKLDLDSRKAMEDMILKGEGWASATVKASSIIDLEMSKAGDAVKKLQMDWSGATKIMAEDEHAFAQNVIANLKQVETVRTESGIATAKLANQTRSDIDSVIKTFEDYGTQLGYTGKALDRFVEQNVRQSMAKIPGITKEQVDATIKVWKEGLVKLPPIWEEAFGKFPNTVKSAMNDVLGIINTMPGAFGKVAQGILKTAETWIAFADKVLGTLNHINSSIPSSVGGAIGSLTNIFKSGATAASGSVNVIKTAVDSIGPTVASTATTAAKGMSSIGTSAGSAAATVGSAASGIASAMGIVTGAVQAAQGVFSLFQSSFHSSSKADRGVGGFLLGGPIGAILSIFKGGPTKEQLEAQQRERDKFKADLEQTQAQTQTIVMDTMEKARAFFEGLADFSAVPKKAIKRFFNQMNDVLVAFADMASQFKSESLAKSKEVAEALGPVWGFLMSAVDFSKAAKTIEDVSDVSIANLMSAIARVEAGFEKITAEMEKGVVKRAAMMAGKLTAVFDFIKIIPDTLKALSESVPVSDDVLASIFASATHIIDKFSELTDQFNQYSMNKLAKSSKQFGTVFEVFKLIPDTLKSIVDVGPLSADALPDISGFASRVIEAMKSTVDKFVEFSQSFQAEALGKAKIAADNLKSVLDVLQMIPNLLKVFGEQDFKWTGDTTLNLMFSQVIEMVQGFNAMMNNFNDAFVAKTVAAAAQFRLIFDAISSMLGLMKSLGEYKLLDKNVLNLITYDFQVVTDAISTWTDMGNAALDKALNLEDVVRRLRESLGRALTGLSTAATSMTSGAATASLTSSSVTTSSVDQSIHIGGVSLAPGQPGYESLVQAVREMQGTLGGLRQQQRAY